MLAIQGIYNGSQIVPLEAMPTNKKYKIIITFVEEIEDDEDVRPLLAQNSAFEFWNDAREDIYQEYLKP
jgi:hypothetical protein